MPRGTEEKKGAETLANFRASPVVKNGDGKPGKHLLHSWLFIMVKLSFVMIIGLEAEINHRGLLFFGWVITVRRWSIIINVMIDGEPWLKERSVMFNDS